MTFICPYHLVPCLVIRVDRLAPVHCVRSLMTRNHVVTKMSRQNMRRKINWTFFHDLVQKRQVTSFSHIFVAAVKFTTFRSDSKLTLPVILDFPSELLVTGDTSLCIPWPRDAIVSHLWAGAASSKVWTEIPYYLFEPIAHISTTTATNSQSNTIKYHRADEQTVRLCRRLILWFIWNQWSLHEK